MTGRLVALFLELPALADIAEPIDAPGGHVEIDASPFSGCQIKAL